MNKEDLFESFGTLDDDLLQRSEQGEKIMKKRKHFSGFLKYGSIAACLAVAVGAGIFFMDKKTSNPEPVVPESIDIAERNDNISDKQNDLQDKPENYVDISMLLASNEGVYEELSLEFRHVAIEDYSACYHKVSSVGSDILSESIGGEVPERRIGTGYPVMRICSILFPVITMRIPYGNLNLFRKKIIPTVMYCRLFTISILPGILSK